ncbi:MAG: Asp-tRNA(Asn)/Glu-tRNA(Gln) amidotransferase subunit GatC [Candidatus Levybacteria bacterium]|nr:Asp-tRNA(Asn)/Glu-tRNA(Gln) amidotransferase subunit GatC [Candidatus Levybacteria bacterium]
MPTTNTTSSRSSSSSSASITLPRKIKNASPSASQAIFQTTIYFNRDHVRKIKKLADLNILEENLDKYVAPLNKIMSYVNKINEKYTENIDPTSQITGLENIMREDEASSSLSQEEALSNTKSQQNGLFKVKAILDEERVTRHAS